MIFVVLVLILCYSVNFLENQLTFYLFLEEYDEPSSRVENSFDSEEEKRVEVSIKI